MIDIPIAESMVHSKKRTGVQRPKSQTDDNKCSCTLLLKGSTPFSVMSPTLTC